MRLSRREFLARSAAAAVVLGCGARAPKPCGAGRRLTEEEFRIAEALQGRILPSAEGAPGAREVRATAYLDAALEHGSDPRDCPAVTGALAALGPGFVHLSPAAQDAEMRRVLEARGRLWFTVVLGFTMEAFLGDPAHGGNPEGVGWSYLGHPGGGPRP